jgi:hypothetical protein
VWMCLVAVTACILSVQAAARTGRSSSEATRGRERPLLGLSPVKTCTAAMLTAPSSEHKRAMGTPDYLAPEVLLGARPFTCMERPSQGFYVHIEGSRVLGYRASLCWICCVKDVHVPEQIAAGHQHCAVIPFIVSGWEQPCLLRRHWAWQ